MSTRDPRYVAIVRMYDEKIGAAQRDRSGTRYARGARLRALTDERNRALAAIPVLARCAAEDCINTVIVGEDPRCAYHR